MYFWNIERDAFVIRCGWLNDEMKNGENYTAEDIDPTEERSIPTEAELYPKRTDRVSLAKECRTCYLRNNIEWEKVKQDLQLFNRIVNATPYDGNCLFAAVLQQISHPKGYTAEMMRRQVAYFACKAPEKFFKHVKNALETNYRSYCYNLYEGRIYGDIISLTVLAVMWNLAITVLSPNVPALHVYHDKPHNPDIVIVYNGRDGQEGHYTSTGMFNFLLIAITGVIWCNA